MGDKVKGHRLQEVPGLDWNPPIYYSPAGGLGQVTEPL